MKNFLSKLFNVVRNHQFHLALAVGYILVAGVFFSVGRIASQNTIPPVKIEEPQVNLEQVYNNLNPVPPQSTTSTGLVAGTTATNGQAFDCGGKIKATPSSKIYHVPGDAFYDRLKTGVCFDTEKQAQEAGFRKSLR